MCSVLYLQHRHVLMYVCTYIFVHMYVRTCSEFLCCKVTGKRQQTKWKLNDILLCCRHRLNTRMCVCVCGLMHMQASIPAYVCVFVSDCLINENNYPKQRRARVSQYIFERKAFQVTDAAALQQPCKLKEVTRGSTERVSVCSKSL